MTKANFTNVANEEDLQWKTTSNGRLPQISKVRYLSNYWPDLPQILYLGYVTKANFANVFNEDDLQWKTTSNIKSEISQHLSLCDQTKTLQMFQLKITSNGRQLQLSKVKNLSSYWLILPQFQN